MLSSDYDKECIYTHVLLYTIRELYISILYMLKWMNRLQKCKFNDTSTAVDVLLLLFYVILCIEYYNRYLTKEKCAFRRAPINTILF